MRGCWGALIFTSAVGFGGFDSTPASSFALFKDFTNFQIFSMIFKDFTPASLFCTFQRYSKIWKYTCFVFLPFSKRHFAAVWNNVVFQTYLGIFCTAGIYEVKLCANMYELRCRISCDLNGQKKGKKWIYHICNFSIDFGIKPPPDIIKQESFFGKVLTCDNEKNFRGIKKTVFISHSKLTF